MLDRPAGFEAVTVAVNQGYKHSPSHHTGSGIDIDFLVRGSWVRKVLFSGDSNSASKDGAITRSYALASWPSKVKLFNPTVSCAWFKALLLASA